MGDRAREKEADAEEALRRKFRMKCLFRALVRLVLANAYWLLESADDYQGVDDVKRRVEQAVRGKGKKTQLLNINDKTLLNKPAEDRTEQEKRYLYRIIGGLKCFKRYPNNVKRKLAAVTYFKYYGPGRTIVRQHHEANALYFIVTGDVVISQMIFDELLQQYVSVDVGVMNPGDMFGEVSLLHNIPRTATVTTTGHCELLALMKEDFKNVLQASVQKQWDEVRNAMSAFSYFESLDEVARREGCIVAKMKSYSTNETLLGDGVGIQNFVYFILSGKCQMIESMQVIVTTHLGRNYYALYDPHTSKEESDQDLETKYFANVKVDDKLSLLSEGTSSMHKISGENNAITKVDVESSKDRGTETRLSNPTKQEKCDNIHVTLREEESCQIKVINSLESDNNKSFDLLRRQTDRSHDSLSTCNVLSIESTIKEIMWKQFFTMVSYVFVWVCQLYPGSSFGFGENMRDRRIVALTPVSCMLLPKVWLLQRNTANIWTRIKYYLDKKILSKKQLFEEFVAARRWNEYREQLVNDVVARSHTVNYTSIHDVPYSIRVEDMLDV